jgi:hypothetical protein
MMGKQVAAWLLALAVIVGLRAAGLRTLATLVAVGWLLYCVWSWTAPWLVRRLTRR